MNANVLLALPVGLGHIFVICDRDDWRNVKDSFKDPHEVDLEDQSGRMVTIDLYDVVSNAVVSEFDEDAEGSVFAELEANGVTVFDALCYAMNPDKRDREEANFFTNVMALIKKIEGQIHDTRAIGLVKSRIAFYFRGRKYHVLMDALHVPPTYTFGADDSSDFEVLTQNYIEEMRNILSKVPDIIGAEVDQEAPTEKSAEIADLAAFDEAFGICEGDECELK
jgi:hypothetical protein